MAAKFSSFCIRRTCVLQALIPHCAATSKVSVKATSSSYFAARKLSLLCSKPINVPRSKCDGVKVDGRGRAHVKFNGSLSDTEFSYTEEKEDVKDTKILKKLTLDDIVLQWPDKKPIWSDYRRNHKGQIPRKRTRLRCTTVSKKLLSQNPCPVCRVRVQDNYEMNSKDVVFLSQFISPYTGQVLDTNKTGVCRQQQKKLIHTVEQSRDQGHLPFTIPGPRDDIKPFKAAGMPAPNLRNKT